jgi:hypothetical protein
LIGKNFEIKIPTQWHIDNLFDLMGMNWILYSDYLEKNIAKMRLNFFAMNKPIICLPKNDCFTNSKRLVIQDFGEDHKLLLFLWTRRIVLIGEFSDPKRFSCI